MAGIVHAQPNTGPLSEDEQAWLDEAWARHPHPDDDLPDPVEATILAYEAIARTALSTKQAAEVLRTVPRRIRQRLHNRTLYGIMRSGRWFLPAFQFSGHKGVPGLSQVLPNLAADLHPVELLTWLTLPNADLRVRGRAVSPLEWLHSGRRVAPVVALGRDL
jgi:hypothetical protein